MSTTIFKLIYLIAFFVIPALAHADEKLGLSGLLEMVRNHNPDLAITQARSNQSSALSGEGLILPPPTLTYGSMGMNGALSSNGKMESSFGISQMIPFPTKLFTDSNVRHYEALSIEKELSGEVLKAYKDAKSAFFTLLGARKKIVLLEERESVLEDHFKRVNSTSLSDRIAQAHRTWVQTEIELVKNDLIAAREEEKSASGNLNYIVGSDPNSVIPALDEPPISELPVEQSDVKSSQPELSSIDASLQAAQANLSLAKALWLPDFNLSYRNARRFDGVMPNYTEVTIGVTLPFLFFWEPKAQVAAASARTEELGAKLEKTRKSLKLELLQTRTRAESLHAQLLNYEQKIIPQAEKRMHLAHGLVPSDMESFVEHRDAMLSVVDLKIAQLNMRIEYEKILTKLETLLAGDAPEKDKI